jgi:signal transduction histidine kinase
VGSSDTPARFDSGLTAPYRICLALGFLAIAAYYLLDGLPQDVLYDATRIVAALTIFAAVRQSRTTGRVPWFLIGLGQLLFGLGDVTWDIYKHVHHVDPFPSGADLFYLAAYPALGAGVLAQLRRAFPGRDRTAIVDTAIVVTALGLVIWVLVLQPTARDLELTVVERAISLAYPLMDIVLVAMGARLAFARRMQTLASSLWDLGLVSLLAADTAFLATQRAGTYQDGSLIDAAFLLSGVLWAAAALHQAAAVTLPTPPCDRPAEGVVRAAVVFGAALIGPSLIVIQGARGEDRRLGVTLVAAVALLSLSLLRMTGTRMPPPIRTLALSAAGVGALVTLSLNTFSGLRLTYTNVALRSALDTAQALIAMLVTYLVYLRFLRTRLFGDILLLYGIGLLGAGNLFAVLASGVGRQPSSTVVLTWVPLLIRVIAASAIVWAAWTPLRRIKMQNVVPRVLAAHLSSVVVVAVAVAALQDHLPVAMARTGALTGSPSVTGQAVLLAAQLVLMALFWLSAGGFVRRSHDEPVSLTAALVAGFILAGFSRLSFSLNPTLYPDVIDTGDVLRLGSYLTFLVGAGLEIRTYWRGLAEAAVSKERERTARELHDGLVQELSFIRSQAASLISGQAGPETIEQVVRATDRALEESRNAVRVLSGAEEDLTTALRSAAQEIATRSGVDVRVEPETSLSLSADIVASLSRIVREASSNAVRHGQAKRIVVCVERLSGGSLRMAVSDDGCGFEPQAVGGHGGFGLRSMRDRATALGGRLVLASAPGEGTTVEVILTLDGRNFSR